MSYKVYSTYKGLKYHILSEECGWSYEVLDYGKVTNNPISIMSGRSRNPNEYTKEIIKQKIDDYMEVLKYVK